METLPALVSKTMVFLGVWEKPATSIIMRSQETQRRVQSAKTITPTPYEPDNEFIEAGKPSFELFDFDFDDQFKDKRIIVEGTAYLTNGTNYRLQRFTDKATLRTMTEVADKRFGSLIESHGISRPNKMREATSDPGTLDARVTRIYARAKVLLAEGYSIDQAKAVLREDFAGGMGGDFGGFSQDWFTAPDPRGIYGSGYDPEAEYIPMMGGPWNKQLYLQEYLLQHAQAFEAYNHNPVAKQLIDLTTSFVFGRGVDFSCTNIEADEVLREFTERTNYFPRLEQMCTDTWWSGNLFKEWYDNEPEKGQTDFRGHDPSTIWEIVTDPEDIRMVYYYHQQYATPYQNLYAGAGVKDVAPKNIPVMKYIMRHIPAQEMDHVKINCSEWEKYGRSDLFVVLGWLKRLKDLLNARVVKGLLEAAFVWDIEVTTDQGDVNQLAIQLPDPYSPGSTFVHNKSLQMKPQAATMTKGGDTMPDVSELKSMIATGVGTPKEFIGETQRMSRSASLTTTEPGTKRYERRQQLVERIILSDFDRVIKVASAAGAIDIDKMLQDARSVKRLSDKDSEIGSRADVVADKEKAANELTQQDKQKATHLDAQNQATLTGQPPPKALPPPERKITVTSQTRESFTTKDETTALNDRQRRRIETIKKTGRFARELVEVTFPSIAAEDRSAKLKDLALSEAMEWLPKSITATLAAKELNITTYDFETVWRQIVAEAAAGMSLAHVFGQDNKHIPALVQAETVQQEETAMSPPDQQPFENVPVPPAEAGSGFKQEPNKGAGGNGVPPGNKPNSGDTHVQNKGRIQPPNPTAEGPRRGTAGSHPMANDGKRNIKQTEADAYEREANGLQTAIYMHLLREATRPLVTIKTAMAQLVLSNGSAVEQFEAAVEALQNSDV